MCGARERTHVRAAVAIEAPQQLSLRGACAPARWNSTWLIGQHNASSINGVLDAVGLMLLEVVRGQCVVMATKVQLQSALVRIQTRT